MIPKNSKSQKRSGQEKRLETLDAKTEKQKLSFLENLGKSSIVQLACERTGIGRSTYYDWRKKDGAFARAADGAMRLGVLLVNDIAESQLVRAIQNGKMTAIIFWLKNHHSSYCDTVHHEHEFLETEISPKEHVAIAKALFNAGHLTKYGRNAMIKDAGEAPPPDVLGEEETINEVIEQVEKDRLAALNEPPSPAMVSSRVASTPKPVRERKGVNIAEFVKKRQKAEEEKKRLGGK